jgi:charged multivesicular body protein 7
MKSYESSTTTLRALLAHPSLQRDTVDKTMDALANANADAREVDDAIRFSGDAMLSESSAAAGAVDEDEIARELEELVREEEDSRRGERGRREREERVSPVSAVSTPVRRDSRTESRRDERQRVLEPA